MRINIKDLDKYSFDFIGDVHGCFDKLCLLLQKMGYTKDSEGIYFHRKRKAFFLGDVVDGGTQVQESFTLVKRMVEKGYAFCIMGNHEINLIAINTKYKNKNEYLRERSNSKLRQCINSLDLILGKEEKENIAFLKSLPLFIETNSFRAIHACWHQESIDILKNITDESNCLSDENFYTMYEEKGASYDAMEKVLKGLELDLPKELTFTDSYGNKRDKCRFNWWDEHKDYEDRIISDKPIIHTYNKYNDEKVVFFGHYWMTGQPYLTSSKAICLDFSAVKGGSLCAFRFDGSVQKDCLFFVQ